MISFIRIKNFKSIVDTCLDMRFDEGKAPNGYNDNPEYIFLEGAGMRVVPVQVLYGANASGKTCILSAIDSFRLLLAYGIKYSLYRPNRLKVCSNYTTFVAECLILSHRCRYSISYDDRQIVKEVLWVDDIERFSVNDGQLSSKIEGGTLYTESRLREVFATECCSIEGLQTRAFLSVIAEKYSQLDLLISKVYVSLFTCLFVFPSISIDVSVAFNFYCSTYSIYHETGSFGECKKNILSLVNKFDIDISDISFDVKKNSGDDYWSFLNWKTLHRNVNKENVWFEFDDESDGTKRLVSLISCALAVLETGGSLIVDEIDCSLHSAILPMIIGLFKDKRYNTKNAQLICTTHNTDLLDNHLLRVSEVGIVCKTLQSGSCIRRLSQIEGVRNVNNFRKQYLEGLYSGIPFPYI